jgi:hypothetical protein
VGLVPLTDGLAQLERGGEWSEAGSNNNYLVWAADHIPTPSMGRDSIVPRVAWNFIRCNYPIRSIAGVHTTTIAHNGVVVLW